MAERTLLLRVIADDRSMQQAMLRDQKAVQRFGDTSTTALGKFDSAFAKTQKLAAGGFLGGAAIVAVTSFAKQAAEAEQILGQTKVALEAAGKSWDVYGDQVEAAIKAQSDLGFDDEALLKTFSTFVRQTDDVTAALDRNQLALDIARARFIDLDQAAGIVTKAALGQAGALRRIGIDAEKGASGVELLAQLQREFGGSAVKAADDAATAFDRMNVQVENAKEALGNLTLPVMQNFADVTMVAAEAVQFLADQLGGLDKQEDRITFGDLFSSITDIPALFEKSLTPPWKWDEIAKSQAAAAQTELNKEFSKVQILLPGLTGPISGGGKELGELFGENIAGAFEAAQKAAEAAIEEGQRRIDAAETRRKLEEGFERLLSGLELKLDRSGLTKNLDDDLAALQDLKAGLEKQIRAGVDVASAQTRLVAVMIEIKSTRAQLAQQARDVEQARQFRALGLSGTGEEIVPGIQNLQKRLNQALAKINTGELDVPRKMVDRLKAARELIRKEGGRLTEETRRMIDGFLKALSGDDSATRRGPLTQASSIGSKLEKLLAGLGLSRDQEKELRARLSGFNSQGRALAGNQTNGSSGGVSTGPAQPLVVNMEIDGRTIAVATYPDINREAQKNSRRNSVQKTGPNAGRRSGI